METGKFANFSIDKKDNQNKILLEIRNIKENMPYKYK